jgi:Helix-turn-helix domain
VSVQASTRVMEYSEAAGVNRLVLLVMANRAGGDFDECFASTDRIAFECRIDVRTVQRAVKRLVSAGELTLVGIHPRHRTNIYRVMPAATVAMFPAAGVAESHPPGASTPPAPPELKEQGLTLSVASSSSHPTLRAESARQRDRLFEALLDVENILPGDKLTRSARGKLNSAAKQLREVDATADDVRARAAIYRRKHPTWELTAPSLVKHWPSLNGSTVDARPTPDTGLDDSWLFERAVERIEDA